MTKATKQVTVHNNEPSVHCIDVSNRLGERVLRIRPHAASCGIAITGGMIIPAVVLNFDELIALLEGLGRIEAMQGRALADLEDADRPNPRDVAALGGDPSL